MPRRADPAKPIARNTPCPKCGYNLRGLAGDPVRCPECGNKTRRARLRRRAPEFPAAYEPIRQLGQFMGGWAIFGPAILFVSKSTGNEAPSFVAAVISVTFVTLLVMVLRGRPRAAHGPDPALWVFLFAAIEIFTYLFSTATAIIVSLYLMVRLERDYMGAAWLAVILALYLLRPFRMFGAAARRAAESASGDDT